jgi:hypothetical protein
MATNDSTTATATAIATMEQQGIATEANFSNGKQNISIGSSTTYVNTTTEPALTNTPSVDHQGSSSGGGDVACSGVNANAYATSTDTTSNQNKMMIHLAEKPPPKKNDDGDNLSSAANSIMLMQDEMETETEDTNCDNNGNNGKVVGTVVEYSNTNVTIATANDDASGKPRAPSGSTMTVGEVHCHVPGFVPATVTTTLRTLPIPTTSQLAPQAAHLTAAVKNVVTSPAVVAAATLTTATAIAPVAAPTTTPPPPTAAPVPQIASPTFSLQQPVATGKETAVATATAMATAIPVTTPPAMTQGHAPPASSFAMTAHQQNIVTPAQGPESQAEAEAGPSKVATMAMTVSPKSKKSLSFIQASSSKSDVNNAATSIGNEKRSTTQAQAQVVKERKTNSILGAASLEDLAIARLHRRILSLPDTTTTSSNSKSSTIAGNGCICVLQKSQENRLLLDPQPPLSLSVQNKKTAPVSQASVVQVNELLPFVTLLEKMLTASSTSISSLEPPLATANIKSTTTTPTMQPQSQPPQVPGQAQAPVVNRVLISCDSPQMAERWNVAFQTLHKIMSPHEKNENLSTATATPTTGSNSTSTSCLPSWVANLAIRPGGTDETKHTNNSASASVLAHKCEELRLRKELEALHIASSRSKVVIVTHAIVKSNFSELDKAFGPQQVDVDTGGEKKSKHICDLLILCNAVGSSQMSALMDHTDSTRSALYGIPCQRRVVILLAEKGDLGTTGDTIVTAGTKTALPTAQPSLADRGMTLLLLLCSFLQKTDDDEDGDGDDGGDDDDSTASDEESHLALLKRFYAMVEICHCPSTILALMGRLDLFMGACQERLQTRINEAAIAAAAAPGTTNNASSSPTNKLWLPHVLESDIGRQLALVVQRIVIPFFEMDHQKQQQQQQPLSSLASRPSTTAKVAAQQTTYAAAATGSWKNNSAPVSHQGQQHLQQQQYQQHHQTAAATQAPTQYYGYNQYPYNAYGGYYYHGGNNNAAAASSSSAGAYYAAPYAPQAQATCHNNSSATTTASLADHPYAAYYHQQQQLQLQQQGYYALPSSSQQQPYLGYSQSSGNAVAVTRASNGQYQYQYPPMVQQTAAAGVAAAPSSSRAAADARQQAEEDAAFASANRPNLQEQEQEFQEGRRVDVHGQTAEEGKHENQVDDSAGDAANHRTKPSPPPSSTKRQRREKEDDTEYVYMSASDEDVADKDSDFEMEPDDSEFQPEGASSSPRGRKRSSTTRSTSGVKKTNFTAKLTSPERPRRAGSQKANYKEIEFSASDMNNDDEDNGDGDDDEEEEEEEDSDNESAERRIRHGQDPHKFHKLCKVELEETLRRLHKQSQALQIPWYNKQDKCMHFLPKYMVWSRLPRGYAIDNEANTLEMLLQWMCPDEDRNIAPLRCLTEQDDFQLVKHGITWFRQLSNFMRWFEMDHCLSLVDANSDFLLRPNTPPTQQQVWEWYDAAHAKVFAPLLKKKMQKQGPGGGRSRRRRGNSKDDAAAGDDDDDVDGWENQHNFCNMPWIKVYHLLKEERRLATGKKGNGVDVILTL